MPIPKEVRDINLLHSQCRKLPYEKKLELYNFLVTPEDEEELDARLDRELRGFMFSASFFWNSSREVKRKREFIKEFIKGLGNASTENKATRGPS